MDLDKLKAEYLAEHRIKSESDLDDDDSPIDVVGGDSEDEHENSSSHSDIIEDGHDRVGATIIPSTNSFRLNPFSIESLLYSHNSRKQ